MSDKRGYGGNQTKLGGDQGLGDSAGQFTVLGVGEIRDLPEDVDHPGHGTQETK